jgi:hypothetical protein
MIAGSRASTPTSYFSLLLSLQQGSERGSERMIGSGGGEASGGSIQKLGQKGK